MNLKHKVPSLWLLAGVLATAFLITPQYSAEPINLPKLFLLVPTGLGLAFFFIFMNSTFKTNLKNRRLYLVYLFIAQLILTFIFSGAPRNQQFFGANGRNTGLLAYLSFAVILISAYIFASREFGKNLLTMFLIFCGVSEVYGFMQWFKADPIKWQNPYNPIIGFLGNPDFMAALLGIFTGLIFYLILKSLILRKFNINLYLLPIFVLSFYLTLKTHAQQGIVVIILEAGIFLWIEIFKSKLNRIFLILYTLVTFIIGLLSILGSLRIGPLAPYLYKISVRQRGFYWHAGLNMMKNHPIFGIGLDNYGNEYFKYRSSNAGLISPNVQSNAAHNVFLDLGSNGGYPLFFIYIALVLLTFYVCIRKIIKTENIDQYFLMIFVAWVGYIAQSIISINQIGLAIWGWVFMGALLGYDKLPESPKTKANRKIERGSSFSDFWVLSFGAILGFLIVGPAFTTDHVYKNALVSRNAQNLIDSVNKYPKDISRMLSVSEALVQSNLKPQALTLIDGVLKIQPNNYNAWLLIYKATSPLDVLHTKAESKVKELNPQVKSFG